MKGIKYESMGKKNVKHRHVRLLTLTIGVFMITLVALTLLSENAHAQPPTVIDVDGDYGNGNPADDNNNDKVDATHVKTIQQGVNAVAAGGTVRVFSFTSPPGRYNENVVIGKSLTLTAQAANIIIDGSKRCNVITINANNVVIQGFIIQNGHNGIFINNVNNARIFENNIHDNREDGIRLDSSNHNTIENNAIYNNGLAGVFPNECGIFLADSNNNVISNNDVHHNQFIGIWITGESSSNTVDGNTIHHNGDDGINLEENLAQDGGRRGDDNPAFPASTKIRNNYINDNEHEGIHIYSGSDITIQGNKVYNNSLDGIVFEPDTGNNVVVSNNEVYENGRGGNIGARNGIFIWSDRVIHIDGNNDIHDNPECGIIITRHRNAGPNIPHKIIGNKIHNNGENGIEISPYYGPGTSVNQVIIGNNNIHNNEENGVYLEDSDDDEIKDNDIHDNQQNGIHLRDSNGNKIENKNEIYDNKQDGIYLENSSENEILDENKIYNTANGTQQNGIHLRDSNENKIENNNIHNNKQNGILLDPSNNNEIFENKVCNNQQNGIFLLNSSNNNLVHNNVSNNLNNGIYLVGSNLNFAGFNIVNTNKNNGFYLQFSNNNTLYCNVVDFNNNDGIRIFNSNDNDIIKNFVEQNNVVGIHLGAANGNFIYKNDIIQNGIQFIDAGGNMWDSNYWKPTPPNCPDLPAIVPQACHPETTKTYEGPYYTDEINEWINFGTRIILDATEGGLVPYGVETYYRINIGGEYHPRGSEDTYYYNPDIVLINGTWWYVYTKPIHLHEECTHTIEFFSKNVLNHTEKIKKQTFLVDNTPPTSWLTPSWLGSKHADIGTIITIHAKDGGICAVGLYKIYYIIRKSTGEIYESGEGRWNRPIILNLPLGHYTIEYWAVDGLGNEESHQKRSITVKNWYPKTSIAFEGAHERVGTHWQITPDTLIMFEVDTAGVGLKETKYKIDSGNLTLYEKPFSIPDYGMHEILYYSVDQNGVSEWSFVASWVEVVSSLAPTTTYEITLSPSNKYNGWYRCNVTIKLKAIDSISGVDSTYYKIDKEDWKEYTDPIIIDKDGEHIISFYSIDNAGNKEDAKSVMIKIDKTKPIVNFEKPKYGYLYIVGRQIMPLKNTVIIGKAAVIINANDRTSGIEKIEFYVDGELREVMSKKPYSWLWDERVFFTHSIKVIAYDNAGNIATNEQKVLIFNL